jgi:uncharacterized membrane protein YphA (DoxX/SURF4 family)
MAQTKGSAVGGFYPGDASILDTAGRLLIVGTFIYFLVRNVQPWHVDDHIKRLAASGTPFPRAAFWVGIAMQAAGCAMLLFNVYPAAGAVLLLIFMVAAPLLLLRFWEVDDSGKRLGTQNGFFADIIIIGGLLLLLQNVR